MHQPYPQIQSMLTAQLVTLSLLALVLTGCSAWKPNQTAVDVLAREEPDPTKSMRIQYDSPPSRLVALGAPSAVGGDFNMPALAVADKCRLSIVYPHPNGVPDMASATVALLPEDFDDDGQSLWDRFGGDDQAAATPGAPLAAWTLDVPAWQVNAVVNKLRDANFFRRARPLGAEVYLGVKIDDVAFGKDYKPVAELDAMIVRVQKLGQPLGESATSISTSQSMPPSAQTSNTGPTSGRQPIAPHLGDGRVYRLPVVR